MIDKKSVHGRIEYQLTGKAHKTNGPAVIYPLHGERYWYLFGKAHRYYGPCYKNYWWIHEQFIKDAD